jgi:hypothetical protein
LRPQGCSTLALAGLYEVRYDKVASRRRTEAGRADVDDHRDHRDGQRRPDPRPHAHGNHRRSLGLRNHDVDQLRALMAPPADGSLDTYAGSKAVNNVKNNGPELLKPLPAES